MMEEHVGDKKSSEEEEVDDGREEAVVDPELFSCLLQPSGSDADCEYVGVRRLLLYRKARDGVYRRNVWSLILIYLRFVVAVGFKVSVLMWN